MRTIELLQSLPGVTLRTPELVERATEPLVICWPRAANSPYYSLLYQHSTYPTRYCHGTIDKAISVAERRGATRPTIFHLHWLAPVFWGSKDAELAVTKSTAFLEKLKAFKAAGGHLVWTLHNALEHESRFPEVEIAFRAELAELCDIVHVHALGSVDEITAYSIPSEKLVELRHGHYIGSYPDTVSRSDARIALGLGEDDDVCLFLGRLGAYKGVKHLIAAFRRAHASNPNLKLVIAGERRGGHDPFGKIDPPLSPHEHDAIFYFDGSVADDQLQFFFRAADVSIIPYKRSLTSGTLLLSLSFDVPTAVTDTAMTRSVLFDGRLGATIPAPVGEQQIREAIAEMLRRKRAGELGIDAQLRSEFRDRLAWEDFSLKVVRRLVEQSEDRSGTD